MFFESIQLPVCSVLVPFSTPHVRGVSWYWLGAKGVCRFVPHALCIVLFFTKLDFNPKKLVQEKSRPFGAGTGTPASPREGKQPRGRRGERNRGSVGL